MSLESYMNCLGNLNEEAIVAMIHRKKLKEGKKEIPGRMIDGCNIKYYE